jgi:glutaredoxin
MKEIKKFIFSFILIFFLFSVNFASAESNLNIYFFEGEGCPHCSKEKNYLDILKNKYSGITIYDFEVYPSNENILLLQRIAQEMGMKVDGVPFLIIGDKQFVGFSEYSTPEELENRINYCLSNQCPDRTAGFVGVSASEIIPDQSDTVPDNQVINGDIILPVIGKVSLSSFSLPVLTIIMGGLDGFNPCAMWALLFLISLLLGMKDRKRMWILGTAFIVVSAFVYFLFMAAWLKLILFLGIIFWVKIIIGLVALAGGFYNFKEFFTNKDSGCKITGDEKRKKVFNKIKSITQMQSFWLALGGIIILAFAVNLVELICSAGLPAVYTQVLALSNLASWQYYFYIILYILIFMLDDLFIFFTAMITLQMAGITTKYVRVSRLIGGILMIAIGLLLVFKPQLLMFG